MARFFLWFDPPGCPAGHPTSAHLGVSPAGTPGTPPLSHGRLGITGAWARLFFWGGWKQRDATAKGMGKALRVSCPLAGVRVAQTGRV